MKTSKEMKNAGCRMKNCSSRSRWRRRLPALIVVACAFCLRAQGQYSVDWYKVAGGGGPLSGGNYSLNGTIGQADAGQMSGGNFSLTGGFWSLISVVQTVGAPTLFISHSGNTVTVYWQAVAGWSLQQNNNLAVPGNWSASSGVTTNNGTNSLTINNPSGNLFFRLQHQ